MYVPTISFFNATPTTEIYTLSLHDALPISERRKKHVPTLVRLVKLLVELRIDRAETSLGLLQIDTGIQTCDRRPHAVIAGFVPEIDRARDPNLGLLRVFKSRRHHADDREGH